MKIKHLLLILISLFLVIIVLFLTRNAPKQDISHINIQRNKNKIKTITKKEKQNVSRIEDHKIKNQESKINFIDGKNGTPLSFVNVILCEQKTNTILVRKTGQDGVLGLDRKGLFSVFALNLPLVSILSRYDSISALPYSEITTTSKRPSSSKRRNRCLGISPNPFNPILIFFSIYLNFFISFAKILD